MQHQTINTKDFFQAENERFLHLQTQLVEQYELFFPDPLANKTLVVIPSLSLDTEILSKISGHIHYEERMLCLLMLLRMPRTHLIYLSSMPIDEVIIDYYLHLLPGITGMHARKRLTMLSCYDSSNQPLTAKLLARPRLLEKIKNCIPPHHKAHISGFIVTHLEQTLSLRLGIPIYGCPPALNYWGTKSGSRAIFKRANLPTPFGFENLCDMQEIAEALTELRKNQPSLRKAVVKLNEGFSGDGNAVFRFEDNEKVTQQTLREKMEYVLEEMSYEAFEQKIEMMGGIVETFVEGEIKTSPSVQCRINPLQKIDIISTHDQLLSGESGQVYVGATFPAQEDYRCEIAEYGKIVAQELLKEGVLGRFAVDFISVWKGNKWEHYAIEINLRKGGTTHPFLMLQFLTDGKYDDQKGLYEMPNGQTRCYFATDGLENAQYKTLTPEDLIDLAICNDLHFDGTTQDGVMFHLLGALSEFGKLGVLCVGKTVDDAMAFYQKTVSVLNRATS